MKYLLLCCHEEKQFDSMPKSECDAIMEETVAYCEALGVWKGVRNHYGSWLDIWRLQWTRNGSWHHCLTLGAS